MTTEVERAKALTTEQLAEHLKAVGQAIINDAEKVKLTPGNIQSIHIDVEIAPLEEITSVHYSINRLADPRNPKKEV